MAYGVELTSEAKAIIVEYFSEHPFASVEEVAEAFHLHRNTVGRVRSEWYASEGHRLFCANHLAQAHRNIVRGLKSRNADERRHYTRMVITGCGVTSNVNVNIKGKVQHEHAFNAADLPAAERNERWRNLIAVSPFGRG